MSGNQERRFVNRALKASRYNANDKTFCVCVGSPYHFRSKDLEWILPEIQQSFACAFSEYAYHNCIKLVGLLSEYQYKKVRVEPLIGPTLSAIYDGSYLYWYKEGEEPDRSAFESNLAVEL